MISFEADGADDRTIAQRQTDGSEAHGDRAWRVARQSDVAFRQDEARTG